jgi:hypothetical protein
MLWSILMADTLGLVEELPWVSRQANPRRDSGRFGGAPSVIPARAASPKPRRPSGEAEIESSSVFEGYPWVTSTHQGVAASPSGDLVLRVRTPASSNSLSEERHISMLL